MVSVASSAVVEDALERERRVNLGAQDLAERGQFLRCRFVRYERNHEIKLRPMPVEATGQRVMLSVSEHDAVSEVRVHSPVDVCLVAVSNGVVSRY